MSIDFKGIIEEHNRFAKRHASHVLKQILLSDLLKNLFGIELEDIFLGLEKNVKSTVKGFRGKTDLLYQNIIFEVKIDLDRELEDGKQQLRKYFQALHESDPSLKSVGLITDCIRFIQYVPIIKDEVAGIREISSVDLLEDNSKDVVLWLDSILFSRTQVLPDADDLKFRFGLGSPTYTYMLQSMEDAWDKVKDSESMNIKLRLWKNHMEIVYGKTPTDRSFLEQTYLVVLVKLLLYLRIYGSYGQSPLDVAEVLTGQYFRTFGISNLVEEGYYSWILDTRIYNMIKSSLEALLRELMKYDTAKINEDLFKEIYQEIVRKEDRHRVGEYYTPEWLAELTLSEAFAYHQSLNSGEIPSIFDPACGSGTFLTNAVHLLRNHFFKKDSARALNGILEKVAGADINPLAVYIARANYIFALGDLLSYKKDIISIPVYVADTFKLEAVGDIKEAPKEVYEVDADGDTLWIPSSILEDHLRFNETIERLEKAVLTYLEAGKKRDLSLTSFREKNSRFTQEENEILEKTLSTLLGLIDQERNSVWLFVLSNTLTPLVFQKRKLDIIAGNPPWIAMRFMENVTYQDYIKSRVFSFELIDPQEVQLFSNMEMATVFFNNSIDRYLKENGIIAFVMPRSILTGALQHAQFKKFKNPKVKLIKILDFENVVPLFRVPSCTILGIKGKDNSYPVPLRIYSGVFESRNLRLNKAEPHLKVLEGADKTILRISKIAIPCLCSPAGAPVVMANHTIVAVMFPWLHACFPQRCNRNFLIFAPCNFMQINGG
jgi:SAM-dependent methyltransferase